MHLLLSNEHASRLKIATVIFAAIVALSFASAVPARAIESEPSVTECSNDSTVDITVDSPLADSSVTSSPISVTGSIKGATQIETSIDGAYSATTSIVANQDSFSIPVELPAGRHAVRLVAHSGCGETASALIYVRLQSEPNSQAAELTTAGGVHVGGIGTIGGDKVATLDLLGQFSRDATKDPIVSSLRLGLILIGFLLIGFSTWLGSRFNGALGRQIWRVAGIILIIATFTWMLT